MFWRKKALPAAMAIFAATKDTVSKEHDKTKFLVRIPSTLFDKVSVDFCALIKKAQADNKEWVDIKFNGIWAPMIDNREAK